MTYLGPVGALEYIHIKIVAQMAVFETAGAMFLRANSQLSLVCPKNNPVRGWFLQPAQGPINPESRFPLQRSL